MHALRIVFLRTTCLECKYALYGTRHMFFALVSASRLSCHHYSRPIHGQNGLITFLNACCTEGISHFTLRMLMIGKTSALISLYVPTCVTQE